jgi:hypothetical protein
MQLTKFSDYALRVLMYAHAAGDRRVTIEEIAASYRISRAHLMKAVSRSGGRLQIRSCKRSFGLRGKALAQRANAWLPSRYGSVGSSAIRTRRLATSMIKPILVA